MKTLDSLDCNDVVGWVLIDTIDENTAGDEEHWRWLYILFAYCSFENCPSRIQVHVQEQSPDIKKTPTQENIGSNGYLVQAALRWTYEEEFGYFTEQTLLLQTLSVLSC